MHPYLVIRRLHADGKVDDIRYNALLQRLDDVGAKDLEEED